MRIGIDYTSAVAQGAGIGRYTRGFVDALAKLDSRNEYVLMWAGKGRWDAGLLESKTNFRACHVRIPPNVLAIAWHRLKLPVPVSLFTGHLDLFHSPDFTLPPLRRSAGVVTVHDLSFLLYPECAEARLRSYLEAVVPSSVRRADFVVADSLCTRNDLVCLLDVAPERVEIVYPGVEPRFHPLQGDARLDEVRARWQLERPFILNLGTLEPRKNQVRLINAYAQLKERGNLTHQLVFGGGLGWLYDDIFRRVNELGLKQDVRFLGYVPDNDLPALYSLADVFVFPSLYEGFGLPPLEAMASGTPVICSNSSSLPEVVGEAALLIRPTDTDALVAALEQILGDATLHGELREKGLERARLFTWEQAACRLLDIYERF